MEPKAVTHVDLGVDGLVVAVVEVEAGRHGVDAARALLLLLLGRLLLFRLLLLLLLLLGLRVLRVLLLLIGVVLKVQLSLINLITGNNLLSDFRSCILRDREGTT